MNGFLPELPGGSPQALTTQAGDWFAAKHRGHRLPEHAIEGDAACELCGAHTRPDPEMEEATGFTVCTSCIEATL